MQPFIHLCVRSEFNMDSTVKIDALIDHCQGKQIPAVALTDEHTMHHVVDFMEYSRKTKVKAIFGCEFSLKIQNNVTQHIFILAKNNQGYGHLIKLSSLAFSKPNKEVYITEEELKRYSENVFILVDEEPGFAYEKEQVFVRLRYDGNTHETSAALAQKMGAKLVAADTITHILPKDGKLQQVIQAAKKGQKLVEPTASDYYFKTQEEIEQLYAQYPLAVENTWMIANACNVSFALKGDPDFKQKLPSFPVPEDLVVPENIWKRFNPMPGFVPPTDLEEIRAIAYLIKLSEQGFLEHYAERNAQQIKRIRDELGVIIGKGYVHYFLIIWDFVRYMKLKKISKAPGRGSSAGSMVARVLKIVELDPLEYKLHFERFLNPEREDDPDVDIDISQNRRHEMFEYAQKKYGIKHVGQVITFNVYGATSAINTSGEVFGVSDDMISKITRLIPEKMTITQAMKNGLLDSLKEKIKGTPILTKMMHYAIGMEGYPQNKSRHPAGVIISSQALATHLPVFIDKVNGQPMLVTQIPNNNKQLEKLGYSKIDFLSSRNVDILEEVKQLVMQTKGIDIESIPTDDEKTLEMFRQGALTGVFQMDSKGMREAAITISPQNLKDVMALLALYRPGPMKEIPTYAQNKSSGVIKIRDGQNRLMEGVDDLRPVLEDTYGVIVYQEQINQIAQIWAGYRLGEADLLRRAISKKDGAELQKGRDQFLNASYANGRNKEASERIYDLILAFADYGFPRAHASVYGMLSYQLAWYKANHPLEYMTVLMNSLIEAGGKKKTSKIAEYVAEVKRMGLCVTEPDIHASGVRFEIKEDRIVSGLSMAKNIGLGAAQEIVDKRPYHSFDDFCNRVNPQSVTMLVKESLIKMGALDIFGSRKLMLEQLKKSKINPKKAYYTFEEVPTLAMSEWSEQEKRQFEMEVTGMALKDPLDPYQEWIKNYRLLRGDQYVFGYATECKIQQDKHKKDMAFLKIRDVKGNEYDVVVFASLWNKVQSLIKLYEPVRFKGKEKENMFRVNAIEIEPLPKEIEVVISIPQELGKTSAEKRNQWMQNLQQSIKSVPGLTPVKLAWGKDIRPLTADYCVNEKELIKLIDPNLVQIKKV